MLLVWVNQGYIGPNTQQEVAKSGIELHVVQLEEARKGFVFFPRR